MSTLDWATNADRTVAATGNLDFTDITGNPSLVSFTLSKVSGGNLTGMNVRRSLDGGVTWGAARAVSSGLPLSTAGDAIDLDLVDEKVNAVRFELTVSASMVLHVTGRAGSR